MKKRLLSLLMAMCLMATMVPAAFAADEENGRPIPDELPIVNEADMVQSEEIPVPLSADWSGTGTKDDPYLIYTADGFVTVANMFNNYIGEKYIRLENSIDLSGKTVQEWSGFIKWFEGDFDGNGKTISNIPENCYLIYSTHNATIHDLTLDLGGQAGTLIYYSFRVKMTDGTIEWGHDTLSNITVKSATPVKLTDNSQANYAPFLYSSSPYFTMQDCTNYADIIGNTYASAFYGYYPLPLDLNAYPNDAEITFDNCVNHGNINLRYAGLFFGNPTGLCQERNIAFKDCVNYGEIRGAESAHFFSSDAGANDYFTGTGYFSEMEDKLDPKDGSSSPMRQTCEDATCTHKGEHGNLCVGTDIPGLGVEVVTDDKGVQRDKVVGADSQYDYTITAYYYVNMFLWDENTDELIHDGTARVSITDDKLTAEYVTTELQDAKLHDGELPASATLKDVSQCLYFCDCDGADYGYWLSSEIPFGNEHYLFIRRDQQPTSVDWDVYVSAYKDGQLVDTASLVR